MKKEFFVVITAFLMLLKFSLSSQNNLLDSWNVNGVTGSKSYPDSIGWANDKQSAVP